MAQKMVCDYCLREVTANFTRMSVQTINVDGTTAEAVSDQFEFHPRCYNALQGLITYMRQQQEPPALDPTSSPPVEQPVNDNDPEVVIPVDITTPPASEDPTPVIRVADEAAPTDTT